MSAKNADPNDAVVCAEWLHASLPAWLATDDAAERDAALQALTQWLGRVSVLTSDGGCCLPVRQALRVQMAAQDAWNATAATAGWPPACAALRLQTRWLTTHLFLLGHCAFAVREVAVAYMTHHLRDAEKCIVMCLKTGKELARAGRTAEADKVLTWAASVVAACVGAPGAVVQRFAAEVRFAQLRTTWAGGALERTCELAAQLAEETRDSLTYREALFEFIYDAAMPEDDSADGASSPASLEAAKRLLCLSLRLQGEATIRTVKQRTFLGVTQLQYADVLLRAGEFAAAAAAASQSHELLHTFEPLVVRLKAESQRHAVDDVVALLRLLSDESTVAVVDLCAMASLAMRHNPAAEQRIFAELQRRIAASQSPEDHFRLLCVLTEQASEWSTSELLRCLAAEPQLATTTAETRRFLFCALWKLACDTSDPAARTARTQWRCLDAALRDFAGVASAAETQSVLLDMAHVALAAAPAAGAVGGLDTAALLQTLGRCEAAQAALLPALRVPLLLAQAQLAFALGENVRGIAAVRALLADVSSGDAVVAACSELLVSLLRACLVRQASDVAALCLGAFQTPPLQPPSCALEFAKVYAMGCLCETDPTPFCEVSAVLEVHVCPLLRDAALLPPQEAHWWSRLLWYVADGVAEAAVARAVRLLHIGALLMPTGAADVTELLRGRLAALLDAEFDAFAGGTAVLDVAELEAQRQRLTALLSEEDTSDDVQAQRARVSLFLAHLEASLRAMADSTSCSDGDVDALHLPELLDMPTVCAADLEQVANVCDAAAAAAEARHTSAASTALADAALALMLASAERQLSDGHGSSSTTTTRTPTSNAAARAVLSTLYGAYRMARSLEGRLRVCETVTRAVTHLRSCRAVTSDASSEEGAVDLAAAAEQRLVETVVDFFAVEAWNESVQWNVLQRRQLVERWRSVALAMAESLSESSCTRAAIRDLADQMPLL